MDSERWDALREGLEQVLAAPTEERESALQQAFAGSPELADQARELLAAEEHASERVDGLRERVDIELVARPIAAPAPGARLGRYRLERVLGAGGMGTVYEAVQEEPRRRVAVKVLHGLLSPSSRHRFRRESRTLAKLQHPCIAQIHEAGVEDGLPWFAMEFVEGAKPMPAHADEVGLDLRGRVELFRRLCDAIQYGHQAGVIHRDLKADNVLCDARGHVKVIDFGVARAVDRESATSLFTTTGEIVGTLSTMSPEQLEADASAVTTRSDVWSLGVLLYELATGRLPFDLRGLSLPAAAHVVREGSPRPPIRDERPLDQDLATILGKTLEKEPARRYASAEALSDDLGRWLDRQPILARPPSAAYQLRMLARRHRAAFSALLVSAAVILVSFVAVLLLYLEAEDARIGESEKADALSDSLAQLERETQNARFLSGFLIDTLASPHPSLGGRDVRVADRIDEAVQAVERDLASRPELQADLLLALAATYRGLGLSDDALHCAERAIELGREHWGETSERELDAELELLRSLRLRKDHARGIELARSLIPRIGTLGEDEPRVLQARAELVSLLVARGDFDEAIRRGEELVADADRLLGPDDPISVSCANTLGLALSAASRSADAERPLRRVLAARRAADRDELNAAIAASNLAHCVKDLGRYEEAEPLLREALDAYERELGPHTATVQARGALAALLTERGAVDEAGALATRNAEEAEDVLAPDDPTFLDALGTLAGVRAAQSRHGEAEELFRRCLAGWREGVPPGHPRLVGALRNLAATLFLQQRLDEAEALYREAIRPVDGFAAGIDLLRALDDLAFLCVNQGRNAEARELLDRALAAALELQGSAGPLTRRVRHALARVLEGEGALLAACEAYEEGWRARRDELGAAHPLTLAAQGELSLALSGIGAHERALELARQLVRLCSEGPGPESEEALAARGNLGLILHAAAHEDEALDVQEELLADASDLLGPGDPALLRMRTNYGRTLLAAGRLEEAGSVLAEVHAELASASSPADPDALDVLGTLARIEVDLDRGGTLEPLEEAVRLQERALGSASGMVLETRRCLVERALERGRLEVAATESRLLEERVREHLPAGHWLRGETLALEARTSFARGEVRAACERMAQAVVLLDASLGSQDPRTRRARSELSAWEGDRPSAVEVNPAR